MEKTSKSPLIMGIVIIAVIVGGFIWYSLRTQENVKPLVETTTPTPDNQKSAVETKNHDNIIVSQDASDASLDQDLTNINTQLSGLDQDSSIVTEGLSAPTEPQQ